jgi:predicted nuclease of predicted toxin-antitoxin system
MSYRVLCDENVEEETISELERREITATHVSDVPGAGSPDETVAEHALENGFVLLTNDSDFLNEENFPAVTVLYYPDNDVSAHELARRIDDLSTWVPDSDDLGRVTFLSE